MGQQYLGLSLFIILLCFFIVLNSLSSFETSKAQKAVQSVQFAFSGKTEEQEGALPSVRMTPTQSLEEGDALDKLKALFSAQIKSFKVSTNRLGTEMMVRLPVAEFDAALRSASDAGFTEESAFKKKGGAFLPTLVSLLETAQTEVPYRMDILLNIPENPATMSVDNSDRAQKILKQTAEFSRRLETAGMPRKLVSTGVAQSRKDHAFDESGEYIELYFRRYVAVDPLSGERLSGNGE